MADEDDKAAGEPLRPGTEHPLMRDLLNGSLTESEFAILREILSDPNSISLSEAEAILKAHGLSGKPKH